MTTPDWLALCASLCRSCEPLSAEELAEQQSLRAAEMARAEKRRDPQPQLELPT